MNSKCWYVLNLWTCTLFSKVLRKWELVYSGHRLRLGFQSYVRSFCKFLESIFKQLHSIAVSFRVHSLSTLPCLSYMRIISLRRSLKIDFNLTNLLYSSASISFKKPNFSMAFWVSWILKLQRIDREITAQIFEWRVSKILLLFSHSLFSSSLEFFLSCWFYNLVVPAMSLHVLGY